MDEKSNVTFSSNVEIMKTNSTLKLDVAFCRKISDYYALRKLFQICDYSTNSYKYVFTSQQTKILCPDSSVYGFSPRKEDPIIVARNKALDNEYGYNYYLENGEVHLNDLIDEFELD